MADTPTMAVRWPGKFGSAIVTIDAADFDPAIHHLPDEPEESVEDPPIIKSERGHRRGTR